MVTLTVLMSPLRQRSSDYAQLREKGGLTVKDLKSTPGR